MIESLEGRIQQTIDRLKRDEMGFAQEIDIMAAKRSFVIEERTNLEAMLVNWEDDNSGR